MLLTSCGIVNIVQKVPCGIEEWETLNTLIVADEIAFIIMLY